MRQRQLHLAKEKLYSEITQTMKMYSSEKHQLIKQLANLRHDLTDLKLPEIGPKVYDPYDTPRIDPKTCLVTNKKVRRNKKSGRKIMAKSDTETSDYESDFEKSMSDNETGLNPDESGNECIEYDNHDEKSVNLPFSGPGSNPDMQWYSGKNLRHSSLDMTAKLQRLQSNFAMDQEREIKIHKFSVSDCQRCEIQLPTVRGINKKRVKFGSKTAVKIIPPEETQQDNSVMRKVRTEKLPSVEGWKIKQSARSQTKGRNSPSCTYLPPLKRKTDKRSLEMIPETLTESAEWKRLYLNIHDEEKRNKKLSDILHAVRIRMKCNERNLKFGECRSPDRTDNSLCDYLFISQKKKERQKQEQFPSLAPDRNVCRPQPVNLQSYLHKLSRQRRLPTITTHKQLKDIL